MPHPGCVCKIVTWMTSFVQQTVAKSHFASVIDSQSRFMTSREDAACCTVSLDSAAETHCCIRSDQNNVSLSNIVRTKAHHICWAGMKNVGILIVVIFRSYIKITTFFKNSQSHNELHYYLITQPMSLYVCLPCQWLFKKNVVTFAKKKCIDFRH